MLKLKHTNLLHAELLVNLLQVLQLRQSRDGFHTDRRHWTRVASFRCHGSAVSHLPTQDRIQKRRHNYAEGEFPPWIQSVRLGPEAGPDRGDGSGAFSKQCVSESSPSYNKSVFKKTQHFIWEMGFAVTTRVVALITAHASSHAGNYLPDGGDIKI